jgi:hypothetical protein
VSNVTVLPLTVHTLVVLEVKVTARPELAVALIAKGAAPMLFDGSAPKVMVCAVSARTLPVQHSARAPQIKSSVRDQRAKAGDFVVLLLIGFAILARSGACAPPGILPCFFIWFETAPDSVALTQTPMSFL